MHVLQSQLVNYSYGNHVEKNIKLLRWWILGNMEDGSGSKDFVLPFTLEQEDIFMKFMDDHSANFPVEKRETFDSKNLPLPSLVFEDLESDPEKPCILLIRAHSHSEIKGICRRMDIVFLNDELPIQLPFDLAGEVILERV